MMKGIKSVPKLDAQKIDCRKEINTIGLGLYLI
jgi:hypothetical protein